VTPLICFSCSIVGIKCILAGLPRFIDNVLVNTKELRSFLGIVTRYKRGIGLNKNGIILLCKCENNQKIEINLNDRVFSLKPSFKKACLPFLKGY